MCAANTIANGLFHNRTLKLMVLFDYDLNCVGTYEKLTLKRGMLPDLIIEKEKA